jgi:hypothetical protein
LRKLAWLRCHFFIGKKIDTTFLHVRLLLHALHFKVQIFHFQEYFLYLLESISSTFYARIFLYESKLSSFSLIMFSFVIFGDTILYEKCACKMLMKLTAALSLFALSRPLFKKYSKPQFFVRRKFYVSCFTFPFLHTCMSLYFLI